MDAGEGSMRVEGGESGEGMGEGLLWVVGALHPAPAETATGLESSGEGRTSVGAGAAVLFAPDGGGSVPFSGAGVESAEATTWDLFE